GRQDGDARAGRGQDELLVEMAEDDVSEAGLAALAAVALEVGDGQLRLVLEIRARQALLHAVDERARHAARDDLQSQPRHRIFRGEVPKTIRIIVIIYEIAMHDEVLPRPRPQRVLERDVADRRLGERAVEEEVPIAFDVVDFDAAVAQRAHAAELFVDLLAERAEDHALQRARVPAKV